MDPNNPIDPSVVDDASSIGESADSSVDGKLAAPAAANDLANATEGINSPDAASATAESSVVASSGDEDAVTESPPVLAQQDLGDDDSAPGSSPVGDLDPGNAGVEDIADPFDEIELDADVQPIEEDVGDVEEVKSERCWYILKVQSNREKSICDALARRVKVEGLDRFFGEIMVPTEDVAEYKNGKRRIVKRKLYPGYIVANMVLNEDTWFLVRETPGIGDFTGAVGKPTPMLSEEVDRIIKSVSPDEEESESIKTAIPFKMGDRIRIKEGTFGNFEGDVDSIDEANGRITVMINIFGRSTPVELQHWQVEAV